MFILTVQFMFFKYVVLNLRHKIPVAYIDYKTGVKLIIVSRYFIPTSIDFSEILEN